MKAELLTVPLLLALGPLAPAAHPPGAAALQTPEEHQAFREAFKKAMSIGSKAEMQSLVKKHTDEAVFWIIDTAELIANAPSDAVFDRYEALGTAWKAAIKTDFCDRMERYYSRLSLKPALRRERVRLRNSYDTQYKAYFANVEKKDLPTFTRIALEFEGLGRAFVDVGDQFYASQSWSFAAICFDEGNLGNKADLKRATQAYGKCIELREKIGLKDRIYLVDKPRYERLVALGFGPKAEVRPGAGPGGEPGAVDAAAAPVAVEVAMSFEVAELDAIERPSYYLDQLYPMWNSITLQSKGSRVPLPRVENGPSLLRLGAADIRIDVDRDGTGDGKDDVKVPLKGKVEPVVFPIGEGEDRREWAFLAVTGLQRDTYQDLELNLEPTDDLVNIFVAPAASMTGTVAGTPIRVFDDNLDGLYGSPPQSWGHVGMTEGHFQPELDSIQIGTAKHALPWSEYQKIGDRWYKLEVLNGGKRITALPAELRTGFMKLVYKGPKASYVVLKGINDYENSYFDISGGKPVEVPLGRYSLFFGIVSKGKGKQRMKAVMIAGQTTPSWDLLEDGQEVVVQLGSPFGFDWDSGVEEREIFITGTSVCVVGRAGERYERIWGAVPRPAVSYRKAGGKRGSKPEDMKKILDQDMLFAMGGWKAAWFPRDLTIKKKARDSEVEVQLVEKKNKLFGKITSEWK